MDHFAVRVEKLTSCALGGRRRRLLEWLELMELVDLVVKVELVERLERLERRGIDWVVSAQA